MIAQCDHCGSPIVRDAPTYYQVESLIKAYRELWQSLLSDERDRDQCGVPLDQQRRHVAVEQFIQAGRKVWGDQ